MSVISGSYISDWKDIVDHHDFEKRLMTMCMDLATPNTNVSTSQNIIQCIDGTEDEGNGKNKRFPVQ